MSDEGVNIIYDIETTSKLGRKLGSIVERYSAAPERIREAFEKECWEDFVSLVPELEKRIKQGSEHNEFLKECKNLLETKGLEQGDFAYCKTEEGMVPCLIARVLVPTFQMWTMGKTEIFAKVRTKESSEKSVKYKDLYKNNNASKVLFGKG